MDSDNFGLSSGDEADLLEAEETNSLKRKNSDDHAPVVKVARTGSDNAHTVKLANEVLQNRFQIPSFRLKQEAAINRLLQGKSAVVVFPTGKSKSLTCFIATG